MRPFQVFDETDSLASRRGWQSCCWSGLAHGYIGYFSLRGAGGSRHWRFHIPLRGIVESPRTGKGRLAHDQLRRQELYKEFIEQASELYIHALQNDKPDVSGLMRLYAEISRMRILSSPTVVNSADQIVKNIIHIYLEPNKTFPELREMAVSGLIDPLRNFSEACRAESETLHYEPPD